MTFSFFLEKIRLPQWGEVYYAEEVTSTNDVAAQLYKQGEPLFTAVWANAQSQGRGRLGRTWQTYPDVGLAFSVVVPECGHLLPIIVSVCLHKALSRFAEDRLAQNLTIKWPNDILIGEKKLAGILVESHTDCEGKRFYVVGVGLNVCAPPQGFVDAPNAEALNQICQAVPERSFVLATILQELQKNLDLPPQNDKDADIINYYKTHCDTFGKRITWHDGEKAIDGIARDITPKGHLVLETDKDEITCHVGEVIVHK